MCRTEWPFTSFTAIHTGDKREREIKARRREREQRKHHHLHIPSPTSTTANQAEEMAKWVTLLLTLLAATTTLLPTSLAFNRYTIGGSKGWNPGVNYTVWANDTRFYVGDWLVFYYQSGMADVVQVNKTDYENCIAERPISNWSRGRSYAFRLNHTGDYYFICSMGYCYQGMKLHILSEKLPPPSPPPSHHRNAAAVPPRGGFLRRAIAAALLLAAAAL